MRLEIDGLEVAYGRTTVLHGVTLDVPDGSLVCLMGRNGVGKTTLLNAVMGLLPARQGSVRVDGTDITRLAPHRRARMGIGYVPQSHPVFPHLTARENLRVVIERSKGMDASAVDDALDVFPALRALLDRPAGLLSGGQAQQLAIARALAARPRLLLLDEPTEGIQPSIILEIEDAIAALHRETGLTILLVEQYVEFALRLAERYAVMEAGEIVASGETAAAELDRFAELLSV
jgi:urea transport system ATP-binding protein